MMAVWPILRSNYTACDFSHGQAHLALEQCWQQGQSASFEGVSGLIIHFRAWQPAAAQAAMVLIPGRVEACHKYLELIDDALQAGFAVFCIDHRGQGRSERCTADNQIGDVVDFQDYVTDLATWIRHEIQPRCSLPLLAIAHSMGGGILCRYLQTQPQHGLTAAIFSSPMWGIPTGFLPTGLALRLSQACASLNFAVSSRSWYVPGQAPYQNKPFDGNTLSSCESRYRWFRQLYQQYPEYQLGGISWRWLYQALTACQAIQQGPAPAIPVLLLQAEAEQVVSNQAQNRLWQHWQQQTAAPLLCKQQLASAQHELLMENDQIRQQWYQHVNQFLLALSQCQNLPVRDGSTLPRL